MSLLRSRVLATAVCLLAALCHEVTAGRCTESMTSVAGSLKGVSVGPAGVWGVNGQNEIFYRTDTYGDASSGGSSWELVSGLLKQIDVGADIAWGVNAEDNIYYRTGSDWQLVEGLLKHISVSPRGQVWGVNSTNQIFIRNGISSSNPGGDSWTQISGQLKQISVGYAGVWGVNSDNKIYYREGTYGDYCGKGSDWIQVDDGGIELKYISSAEGYVVGLGPHGTIYLREGMSFLKPTGTSWKIIDTDQGDLSAIDVYDRQIWAVNTNKHIYYRELFEPIGCF